MSWKFWKTSQTSAIKWPTDAYGSVRFLLGMFLSHNVPPFSQWRTPEVTFSPDIEVTAEISARGYQLAIWFWMFSAKYDAIASRMARDAFCLFADEADPSMGTMIESLLSLQDRVNQAYQDTPREERSLSRDGETTELPLEFFMATGFLLQTSDSPYFGIVGDDMNGDDITLAECLSHAAQQAIAIFTPMQQALVAFDPRTFPKWKWSAHPGAFERHLQRRHDNPLFSERRRVVDADDVYEARVKDARALKAIRDDVAELAEVFLGQTELPMDWHPFLNGIRVRLDTLETRRLVQGGESASLGEALAELRKHVLDIWRVALGNSPEQLEVLNRAETNQHRQREALYGTVWMRHLLSEGTLLPADEVVPALLSEDSVEIAKAVAVMTAEPGLHDALANCRAGALALVRDARASGHALPGIDEKLRILESN
ncbi:tryptophan leader peptide [Paraburkholderia sp. IMGN_8]|uniref:tryptophan leader peptide n=1 Tax=Paraburkholderia sp. IMGN_8 TaxID=3136564 RepID=UPI003100D576